MSKGLERYKVILRFLRVSRAPLTALELQFSVPGSQFSENRVRTFGHVCGTESRCRSGSYFKNLVVCPGSHPHLGPTENWELRTENWFLQSAAANGAGATGFFSPIAALINSTSRQSDCNSRIKTLKDSGTPGSMAAAPFTMAS